MSSRRLKTETDSPSNEGVDSPVCPISEPERWSMPVAVDHEAVIAAAHAYRAEMTVRLGRALVKAVVRCFRDRFLKPIVNWLERERTMRELSRLTEYELKDLGVPAGAISYLVAGKFDPRGETAQDMGHATNENIPPVRVA